MPKGDVVHVVTNKGVLSGPVVKENKLTLWVHLPDGHIIKRHKVKHGTAKPVTSV